MEDPRLLVAVSGGLTALAAGAVGVAANAPAPSHDHANQILFVRMQ